MTFKGPDNDKYSRRADPSATTHHRGDAADVPRTESQRRRGRGTSGPRPGARLRYPCIGLAYAAGRVGGTMTGCLNAANEMANEMFREGAFDYLDIPRAIEAAMESHKADFIAEPSLQDIIDVDLWARENVRAFAASKGKVFA